MERLRTASSDDRAAVSDLLGLSYPVLMAGAYPADLLAQALPLITKANPVLLASGRYGLIEDDAGRLLACGGWSLERPGSGEVVEGLAHIRHFAVHPHAVRHGRGSQLYQWCEDAARTQGMTQFECHASLNAEGFYRRLGFRRNRELGLRLRANVALPAIEMTKRL
jgi:GNAT superfamily N-acetyltransferase